MVIISKNPDILIAQHLRLLSGIDMPRGKKKTFSWAGLGRTDQCTTHVKK
jgi:hypothetical protein